MRRFMCNPAKEAYRLVEAPYMIQFTRFSKAVLQPGVEDEYPYCTYNLTSFTDIPTPGGSTPIFLDVIGRTTAVTDIGTVQSQHQEKPSDTRTIGLEDKEGNEINLVLWGARANEFNAEEIRAASKTSPVIAIFVATLPKIYRGVKGLSGSSACHWYINEDLPEINAFHESFDKELVPVSDNVPGQQAIITAPIRDPPTEMTVQELLALDPFDNQLFPHCGGNDMLNVGALGQRLHALLRAHPERHGLLYQMVHHADVGGRRVVSQGHISSGKINQPLFLELAPSSSSIVI